MPGFEHLIVGEGTSGTGMLTLTLTLILTLILTRQAGHRPVGRAAAQERGDHRRPRLGQVRAAMGAAPIRAYLSAAERPLRRA